MNASEVRHVGGDVSATVIDAAADLASKAQEGAAAAVAGARVVADEVGSRLPGIASAGAEGAAESVKMLQELSDPRLKLLMAFSLGVGAGLWMAGAPTSYHPRGAFSSARGGRRDRLAQSGPGAPSVGLNGWLSRHGRNVLLAASPAPSLWPKCRYRLRHRSWLAP